MGPRGAIVAAALAAVGIAGSGCRPEGPPSPPPGSAAPTSHEARLREARALLAEAGYPGGEGFPQASLLYNTSEAHKIVAVAVQNMWKKGLGIQVRLENAEWKTYLERLSQLDYQIARRGWIGDYFDPYTFLELFAEKSGNNNTGWRSFEFEELLRDANRTLDSTARRALLERSERILLEELPIVPIYFYVSQEMHRDAVMGWIQNLRSIHPLKHVYRKDGDVLVINNHTEVQTLDPAIARGVPEHRIQVGLFEGLLNYDPRTSAPVPGVAERWETSPDGRVYTFHLRACVWSDGRPVTARDFEYAWKRALDPATASDYAHILYFIEGAEAYNTGGGSAGAVGVRAADDRTLVVTLAEPIEFFLDLMPFFTFYPVRKDAIDRHGAQWTKPEHMIVNGPFSLAEWETNAHILLKKNPRYWDAANVRQDAIKVLPTENASTAFELYEAGECQVITAVPLEFVETLRGRPDYHTTDTLGTYFFSFNVTRPPFTDVRVRRALALAVDRAVICEKILRGGQKPAFHFVPPVFPGFRHPHLSE